MRKLTAVSGYFATVGKGIDRGAENRVYLDRSDNDRGHLEW
jgi:hypothetical protein